MKRFVSVLVAACVVAVAAAATTEVVDGVAAIVNDRIITYSEVREFVQPVVQQLRRQHSGQELVDKVRAAQVDALNTLIERALIVQEYKEKGYNIPDTFVEQQINDIIASEFGGNRAAFTKTLAAQNMTLSQYREQVRERVIIQAMRGSKTQKEVVVSPYRIEKYYHDNIDQFKVGDQIKLRMIFVKRTPAEILAARAPAQPPAAAPEPTATTNTPDLQSATSTNSDIDTNADALTPSPLSLAPDTNAAAGAEAAQSPPPLPDPQRKLAEEILSKLDAGDSFESMARVYSEGKEAKEGGDWGWIGRDVLRKELNEVAFTLKPGEHSRIIDTAEGYYILHVEDVKPAHVKPLAEVREEIEKNLLQQQRSKMQQEWVKNLRAKAYIRLY